MELVRGGVGVRSSAAVGVLCGVEEQRGSSESLVQLSLDGLERFPFTSHQSLLQFTVFIHATQKTTACDCLNFNEIQSLPAHGTLSEHRGEFCLHWFGVGTTEKQFMNTCC